MQLELGALLSFEQRIASAPAGCYCDSCAEKQEKKGGWEWMRGRGPGVGPEGSHRRLASRIVKTGEWQVVA
jgi:hypothetical protein